MPHADQVAALEARTIDVAACAEPYITIGLLENRVKTLKEGNGFYYQDKPTEVTTYLARKSWIEANSSISSKFISALTKGLEKSKDRNWLVSQGIPSFNKEKNSSINFVKLTPEQSKSLRLPTVLPYPTEAGLKYVANQLVRYGPIKKAPEEFSSMIYKSTATSQPK
jgi:ABC-type nitrate/sulfonate/bicarbonate transport system substrate-binding protein